MEQTTVAETVAVATEYGQHYTDIIPDVEHVLRLAQLRGDEPRQRVIGTDLTLEELLVYRRLLNAGYTSGWVGADFVMRFPYAARIYKRWISLEPVTRRTYIDVVPEIYIGDIPDAVVNRCEKAKAVGVTSLTVHSLNPLPVTSAEGIEEMALCDPVVVGWVNNPSITCSRNNIVRRCNSSCLGVIVAIWDFGEEVEAFLH